MTTNNLLTTTSYVSIASGVFGLLAVVFIILFAILHGPFGTLNDIFNALMAISSFALAWLLYINRQAKPIASSQVLLMVAILGTLVAIVGSVLVISHLTGWFLAGLYTAAGYAFIGIWLLGLSYAALRAGSLTRSLAIWGMVCSLLMLFGFAALPGIIKSIDAQEKMPKAINYLWQFSFLGTYILYPIWCILFGRYLLRA